MENWIFPTTCENIYFKLLWQTISDAFNSRHNFSDIKMIKYYAEQNSDAFLLKLSLTIGVVAYTFQWKA